MRAATKIWTFDCVAFTNRKYTGIYYHYQIEQQYVLNKSVVYVMCTLAICNDDLV